MAVKTWMAGSSPTNSKLASWCERGLAASLFVLPPLLVLASRGAAVLCGFAGACAAGLLYTRRQPAWFAPVASFAVVLGLLAAWAALSAIWSIDPSRSLILDVRLVGLFASALALAASVRSVTDPARLVHWLLLGTAFGIALAGLDLTTQGGLAQFVSARNFAAPRLNQIAVWLTLLVLPAAVFFYRQRSIWLMAATVIVMGGTVFILADTTAKLALSAGVIAAGVGFVRLRPLARLAALLSFLAILAAPLVLPRVAHDPGLFARIDYYKESAGHRLLIWSFVGDRIAEHPLRGWGLDTSRAIPGGSVDARPGEKYLPLHPHNSALQVWLELGAPGAALFALLIAGLWWRLGETRWPRLYGAATVGSFTAALAVATAGWGIWAEWWVGMLALAAFAILLMARTVSPPPTG